MTLVTALFPLLAVCLFDQNTAPTPAGPSRARTEQRIAKALSANEVESALAAYDAYVRASRTSDVALLRMIAASHLEGVAARANAGTLQPAALEYLAGSANADALEALKKTAASATADAGLEALIALVGLDVEGAAARLGDQLSRAPTTDQLRIIKALTAADARSEASKLLPLLDSVDVPVRTAATLAIGALRYQPAVDRLKLMLTGDPVVRMTASIALRRLGDESMDGRVAPLLTGILPEVRLMAAEGYGPEESRKWTAAIKQLGSDRNESIRIRAAELLACCDKSSARTILVAALDSRLPSVQSEAARVLAEKDLADARLARRLLGSTSDEVRLHGAGATLKLAARPQR
jgi:hypothetical protein